MADLLYYFNMKSEIGKFFIFFASFFLFALPTVSAQELINDYQGVYRAKVLNVVSEKEDYLSGLEIRYTLQRLEAEILDGPEQGRVIEFDNDYIMLKKGDRFFLNHLKTIEGKEIFSVQEVNRLWPLVGLVLFFIAIVIIFGGKKGLKSLLALAASFFIIFYFLFPQLLSGSSPLFTSLGFSLVILVIAIYTTHGLNKLSTAALLGTGATITLTVFLADLAVKITRLSGFTEDASVYLNLNTGGRLDFQGLFLGAIIIGALGVLDDIAITQVAVVRELKHAAPDLPKKEIYKKALRVGKEHVGALVNTLALAYAGAALPVMLFFYTTDLSYTVLNREIFASEIVRTVIGSIAIILSVPITTWLGIFLLTGREKVKEDGEHLHAHTH